MSKRLTNAMRDYLLNKIIEFKFSAQENALKDEEYLAAEQVYIFKYGLNEIKKINDLHEKNGSMFCREDSIYLNLEGYSRERFSFGNKYKPVAHDNRSAFIPRDSKLAEYIIDFLNRKKDLDNKKEELKRKIVSLLYSFSSLKQLKEGWPEGVVFIPKEWEDKKTTSIVIVDTKSINDILGLKE